MEKLNGPLAESLARHRDELNRRFAARQQAGAAIDGAGFLEHLATTVDPIVRALAQVLPERVDLVVSDLYDLSLALFATKWLGPEVKNPAVRDAWQRLLPRVPILVAREPGRLVGSVSNAMIKLAGAPGVRTHAWLDRLTAMAPSCPNVATLLNCGKIVAWQAGMAHYRDGALATVAELDAPLAAASLGLKAESIDKLNVVIERLRKDPWLTPSQAIDAELQPRSMRIVRRAGGFSGFGGPLLRPPKVSIGDGEFVVSDGERSWRLIADAYGAVFVRVEARGLPSAKSPAAVDPEGLVRWNGDSAPFPELTGPSSFVCDDRTLAVTLATSHLVFLLAKT